MEDLRSALNDHVELVSDTFEKFAAEFRRGMRPAYNNFIGFFHAIDWKEPWLICLILFHATLLLGTVLARKNLNVQIFISIIAFSGIYLAERLNTFLAARWKYFAGQNYFDPHGVFISTLWSVPLLLVTMIILVSTLVTTCKLLVQWKRAELRYRARLARRKEE